MIDNRHFEEQLLHESNLRHRAEVADLNLKKAELALSEAEKDVSGLSRLLPFIGKSEKAEMESAGRRLEHWRQKKKSYSDQLAVIEKQLDVSALSKMRENGVGEDLNGIEMKDFYRMARERVEVFRIRVRDFLKALGQARGAMSTGYDNKGEDYSENAKARLDTAMNIAGKLDAALSDIELLNTEFKAKTQGTPYSKIKLPNFSKVNYESGIRTARSLPIAQAQMEFEKTLKDCEQLHDEGVGEAINEIDSLERDHEDIINQTVRQYWQDQQVELLRNTERVEELRANMVKG